VDVFGGWASLGNAARCVTKCSSREVSSITSLPSSAVRSDGDHFVLDASRTSDGMIYNPDYSYEDPRKAQKIASEEIEGELISAYSGTSKEEKKIKTDILDTRLDENL